MKSWLIAGLAAAWASIIYRQPYGERRNLVADWLFKGLKLHHDAIVVLEIILSDTHRMIKKTIVSPAETPVWNG